MPAPTEAAHMEATLAAIFPKDAPTLRSAGVSTGEPDDQVVRTSQREIWRSILMAVVGLLVLESLMAMAFNRSSTAE